MGTCGLTEEAAIEKYPNLDVFIDGDGGGWQAEYFNFTESAEELLVKVLVNVDDDRVVGMWIVGKDAGEIMQGFGAAIKCGVTKQQLFDTVAIHPTIAEELVCIPGVDQMPASRQYRDHKLLKECDFPFCDFAVAGVLPRRAGCANDFTRSRLHFFF